MSIFLYQSIKIKKMKKIILILSISIALISCSKDNKNKLGSLFAPSTFEATDGSTYTSTQLKDSIAASVFFLKDNANKTFVIKDLLVIGYQYSDQDPTEIYCPFYYKEKNAVNYWGYARKHPFTYDNKELTIVEESGGYKIKLSNSKELKKLKLFDPKKEYKNVFDGNIKDCIAIKGKLTSVDYHTIIIEDAEIMN